MRYNPKDEELMKKYPHYERVLDERFGLNSKITNLDTFLISDSFKKLSEDEKSLLEKQNLVMKDYLSILDERVEFYRNKK